MLFFQRIWGFISRLAAEPPFRIFTRILIKYLPTSVRTKLQWDAVERPHYLMGVLQAADQARREGVSEICVIEFGVAAGGGLLTLQKYASMVERETGVKIKVYGFDSGEGLPELIGDYRDHPDQWRPMDYPMDRDALNAKLEDRTTLILGNVGDTVSDFVREKQSAPIGFVSFDLDLYSSTKEAFKIFSLPEKNMLFRVPVYFDDIIFFFNHRFAGEFLAINEFNAENPAVKIDRWWGISKNRVFPENIWLQQMYIVHDLEAISNMHLERMPRPVA